MVRALVLDPSKGSEGRWRRVRGAWVYKREHVVAEIRPHKKLLGRQVYRLTLTVDGNAVPGVTDNYDLVRLKRSGMRWVRDFIAARAAPRPARDKRSFGSTREARVFQRSLADHGHRGAVLGEDRSGAFVMYPGAVPRHVLSEAERNASHVGRYLSRDARRKARRDPSEGKRPRQAIEPKLKELYEDELASLRRRVGKKTLSKELREHAMRRAEERFASEKVWSQLWQDPRYKRMASHYERLIREAVRAENAYRRSGSPEDKTRYERADRLNTRYARLIQRYEEAFEKKHKTGARDARRRR